MCALESSLEEGMKLGNQLGYSGKEAFERKVSVRVRLREESGSVYNRVLKGLNCCLFGALVVVDWCLPELGNMFGGVGGVV